MRSWVYASRQVPCGGRCAGVIRKGAPMLMITIKTVSRPRLRCESCAGEPVDTAALARSVTARAMGALAATGDGGDTQ